MQVLRGEKYTKEDAKLIVVQILRKGYKSGALKDGLSHQYIKDCEYVAIFDADFQPDPDFLLRSIPYLVHNPEIALVQARWVFVEQEVGSSTHAFFGFKCPQKTPKRARFRLGSRLHMLELAVSAYLFGSACYDYTYGNTRYFIYLYIQSMAFLIMGCGYVGTIVLGS
ncbi:hypothetical protein POM88_037514 [Heracleum sosnowskyi]|uniref:Glycosyltransferase 2-like domain-containing protein n=1 Tax=Heracleum sosnowskyi TaxID=360622 RepID=A0AAD8HQ91_9APIA|nr:hypothetical protein POM88_037514 [Heracleum sosnowskyi]